MTRTHNSKIVLKWLAQTVVKGKKMALSWIIFLELLGIGTQVVAFGVLVKYVHAIESNNTIDLGDYLFDPKSSSQLLVLVAVGSGLLFLLSSLSGMRSKYIVANTAQSIEIESYKHLLTIINLGSEVNVSGNDPKSYPNKRDIHRSLSKDTRYCGKVVGLLSDTFVVLTKLLVSLGIMIYIQYKLSIILLLLAIPLIVLLRRVSGKVVSMTKKREHLLPSFLHRTKLLVKAAHEGTLENDANAINDHDDLRRFREIYYGIEKKVHLNGLIIWSYIALVAIVTVYVAGNIVLSGILPWSVFVAYIIGLRFFFVSIRGLSSIMKRASKMYGYISHYHFVVHGLLGTSIEYMSDENFEKEQHGDKSDWSGYENDLDDVEDDDSDI